MDSLRPRLALQPRGRAPLNLSAAHIGELTCEIQALAKGARIRDIQALPPADLLLVLEREAGAGLLRVLVSADPDAPRIHVMHARVARHPGPVGPFFRRVAQEIAGGRVHAIAAVAQDRIVIVEVRDTSGGERRALVAELVGRHSNLVLLGPGDRVIDVLDPPPADKPDARLAPGKPWTAPGGSGGIRGPRRKEVDLEADVRASFPVPAEPPPGAADFAPLSWIVECALGARALEARRERALKKLEERIQRKLSRARTLVNGLKLRLEASSQHERVQQDGELLKSCLPELKRGLKEIEVEDFFAASGEKRRIALDPRLSPHENLERTFERAKKLERALLAVGEELALAESRVAALGSLLERAWAKGSDPESLDAQAVEQGFLDPPQEADVRKKKPVEPRLPYRTFRGLSGAEIRVGRSARDNDALTFRHARGSDLWLHTSEAPGSHVVVRVAAREAEVDPEDLIDAAHLAVHFSPLRGRPRAGVHVARQKEVRKPRGAKPGLVTLAGGKILDVRLQPERLVRLLGSHRPGSGLSGEDA